MYPEPGNKKDEILREVDALIRLHDITEIHALREKIEPKWWESTLRILLFISGLGFCVTVFKLLPQKPLVLLAFVYGWFLLFVLTLLGLIEYLTIKLNALTKLYEFHNRMLTKLVEQASLRGSAGNEADKDK